MCGAIKKRLSVYPLFRLTLIGLSHRLIFWIVISSYLEVLLVLLMILATSEASTLHSFFFFAGTPLIIEYGTYIFSLPYIYTKLYCSFSKNLRFDHIVLVLRLVIMLQMCAWMFSELLSSTSLLERPTRTTI